MLTIAQVRSSLGKGVTEKLIHELAEVLGYDANTREFPEALLEPLKDAFILHQKGRTLDEIKALTRDSNPSEGDVVAVDERALEEAIARGLSPLKNRITEKVRNGVTQMINKAFEEIAPQVPEIVESMLFQRMDNRMLTEAVEKSADTIDVEASTVNESTDPWQDK